MLVANRVEGGQKDVCVFALMDDSRVSDRACQAVCLEQKQRGKLFHDDAHGFDFLLSVLAFVA